MQTMEQKRAADAWQKCQGCEKDYVNLAKSVPALIMNSGLMQVLAFMHEKAGKDPKKPHGKLGEHLRTWLYQQFKGDLKSADFGPFISALMNIENPQKYQQITTEAFAWLRWLRQMAAAGER